jgi:hypothetical protein
MVYFVWECEDNWSPIKKVKELSSNKKKLKGKWQIFVKEHTSKGDESEKIGYRLTLPCGTNYAVFDSRIELVYSGGAPDHVKAERTQQMQANRKNKLTLKREK